MSQELLNKVDQEAVALDEKLEKIGAFLESDKADEISPRHKALLQEQQKAMADYYTALLARVYLLEAEIRGE